MSGPLNLEKGLIVVKTIQEFMTFTEEIFDTKKFPTWHVNAATLLQTWTETVSQLKILKYLPGVVDIHQLQL